MYQSRIKLTDADLEALATDAKAGNSLRTLARRYGVSHEAVRQALSASNPIVCQ
jgi:lambda repressor-like predicted transcriptional regulator